MDRLSQLRGEAGGSGDSTLDTTSPPSEAFMTANESSSKYYSLSEVETTFDISKDVSLASTTADAEGTMTNADELISNLSPIGKKSDVLDSYKIDTQIEAANILSGGVAIFDDNDNSYDGHELVIDDNVEFDDKSSSRDIKTDDNMIESSLISEEADIASKDTEVVLQIDGKNVDAIDIGNGLYLYRKEGQEELAAVQIIDDDQQQPSFKFLKVRENAEGSLEVYEEIEIEVPKEVPAKEGKTADKNTSSHVPIKDINKVISDSTGNKVAERKIKTPRKEPTSTTVEVEAESKETTPDSKSEVNLNGKMMKFSESRKSPVIGSFTPMTYHSTPNKEGIPLTKTMVDQQLHPNRHSDLSNVKKTIEVHTDSSKQKSVDTPTKKDDDNKLNEITSTEKEIIIVEPSDKDIFIVDGKESNTIEIKENSVVSDELKQLEISLPEDKFDDKIIEQGNKVVEDSQEQSEVPMEQDNAIDSTESEVAKVVDDNKSDKDDDLVIVEEKVAEKSETETKMDVESPVTEQAKVEVTKVDSEPKVVESKDEESMEIDDDSQLTIVETVPCVEEIKVQDNTQEKEIKNVEVSVPPKVDEPKVTETILIEDDDDDLSIVEKVEESKEKPKEDIISSERTEPKPASDKVESPKTVEIDSKVDADKPNVEKPVEKTPESADKTPVEEKKQADSTSSNPIIKPDSNKETIIVPDVKKDSPKPSTEISEIKKDAVPTVADKPKTSPETAIPKPIVLKKSDTPPEKSKVLPKETTSNEVKNKVEVPKTDAKQIVKAPEPLKVEITKEPIKHVAIANISPILDQKQSKVAPKIPETTQVPDKIEIKTTPVHNITTKVVEQKSEGKVLEKSPRKEIVKAIETPVSHLQVDSSVNITQVTKYKKPNVVEKPKSDIPQPIKVVAVEKPKSDIPQPIKLPVEKTQPAIKPSQREEKKDIVKPKEVSEKGKIDMEITKVPKVEPAKIVKQDVSSTSKVSQVKKTDAKDKKEMPKVVESKPINNNHAAAVPFGKWTEANRQEFLNKFKTKASVASTNSNQLKNSNDLNRRDVLKKIDSQRQTSNALSKIQEANKPAMKTETAAFSNKPNVISKTVPEKPQKPEPEVKTKAPVAKTATKVEVVPKTESEPAQTTTVTSSKKEGGQRPELVQNLIDKTIEDMIHRTVATPKAQEEAKQNASKEPSASKPQPTYQPIEQATLDAIEMKMNELHGIPFIERPPHELPVVHKPEVIKSYSKIEKEKAPIQNKTTKIPNLLPFPNKTQTKSVKDSVIEVDSEDEIIEHEPITGDIELNKKAQTPKPAAKEKLPTNIAQEKHTSDPKKEAIITEKDFDKFARRNSMTYENCLTVNFDGKETHNVFQTVVEKEPAPKNYSRNDTARGEPKAKLPYKYQNVRPNPQLKVQPVTKVPAANDDASRNQSKLQKAYHSALTAKRQMTTDPITIIEDQPVKVVYMEAPDYVPTQLNVQGQDLSPAKKVPDNEHTVSTCDSLESDTLDSIEDVKAQEEVKTKTKHQRKQVLTPVEEPELELIEPRDLGIEISPKKKRRTDDDRTDKNLKYPMRKKFYLLGSGAIADEKVTNPVEIMKNPLKETVNLNDNGVAHKNPVSALDSLVKAAELIETQTENINTTMSMNSDSQSSTPVKRGRGRPRKYPLPDGSSDNSKNSSPSPQKRPRLIDAKAPKSVTLTDDSDSDGDGAIIKENWTMGKINENIVCPICNKLFRTENVVFKHVKHCTGPSPSRSDSDKRSPRRMRLSQDYDTKSSESKSDDMDIDDDKPLSTVVTKETPKKRKSKDYVTKSEEKDDIIVIEDTPPVKPKAEKLEERKTHESRKPRSKIPNKNNDLVCEFCGKTFRQLSYLVSHKLQHKKAEKVEPKKIEKEAPVTNKSVYSCEVCKKEFRKLHHLVQHRIIHNPSSVPARSSRKSSEQSDTKVKEPSTSKHTDDPSAGFRCEPCDKSFRKLHHLVEHRETHDGINRQKTTTTTTQSKEEKPVEKPVTIHQCDVCKKTFRKLQHLSEHKEQHVETSSEKSDDKSVKSSLSTRDIIHECSLCYMVFPNEHSLTKHTIICQRKKRQSKLLKTTEETEGGDDVTEITSPEEKIEILDSPTPLAEDPKKDEQKQEVVEKVEISKDKPAIKEKTEVVKEKSVEPVNKVEKAPPKVEARAPEVQVPPAKRDFVETETVKTQAISEVPEKIKKIEEKEPVKIHETPKKKTPLKDKTASASKRLKTTAAPPPVAEVKPAVESSDDDDVRYMLNPNFKHEDVTEEKVFMKVRAKKRSSLQIERPNSKDLVKRRTSLQHPPKIPRLKSKAIEPNPAAVKKEAKTPKLEPVPSTDSDDSETTKYSFPSNLSEKPTKSAQERTPKDTEKKTPKKSLADKRKSLSGIAKRKSLGKAATARHKASTLKQVRKRTLDVEHRCDCGQLFSSAALLSRHTTLAHTPPRIRRRRSPSPEPKPVIKPPPRKSSAADKPKKSPAARKSSARSDSSASTSTKPNKSDTKPGKKSIDKEMKSPSERKPKPEKSEAKSSVKPRRTGAHRGVPVPEKMRKLMQKNK
ncbi:uncharacterized protein LOC142973779 [Anticarsia gemmatalis]|uniref:uncharacterized protein LOC142973779 n=1 Tax=Anticarsia gemmatalis TaxID=129554 RepID=UPI003F75A895